MKENLDNVCNNNEVLVVSLSPNKKVAVIPIGEYNSWQETDYLLSTANNRQRLADAINDTERGNFETHPLIDPI